MSVPRSLQLHPAVERTTFEIDGRQVAALRARPDAEAPLGEVVLVHGFTGSKEDFADLLPHLAALGWSATAIDLRGQFESEHDGGALTLDDFARDVLAIAADLAAAHGADAEVHLVGHSFGGMVVRTAVLATEHDVEISIDTVTLLSSGPGGVIDEQADALRRFAMAMRLGAVDAVWEHLATGYQQAGHDADVLAFLEQRLRQGHPEAHASIADALVGEPDRLDALAAAQVEVHVVHGSEDDVWTTDVQEEMARRLAATLTTLSDAGHSPAVEAPDRTARALHEWWIDAR